MQIKTLKKLLLPILEEGIVPWLWGYHGKGKSETIETFYRSQNWLVFNFRLNCMSDVGDFLGLQEFIRDANGKPYATGFMSPEWLIKCIEFCKANPKKRACVFIDEMNRAATMDLLGPVFQMALDKRLHTIEFPPNLDIIVATNPATGNYNVLDLDDAALLSRFWHVDFNPSKDEWFQYAQEKDYDPTILGFLEENTEFLEESNLASFSIGQFAKPDRRKWGMVNKLKKKNFLTEEEQAEVFAGLVGLEISIAYGKYLEKQDKPITADEIVNHYPKVRDRLLKAKTNGQVRTDIINTAANKLKEFFDTDPQLSLQQGDNIFKFIEDLPEEQFFGVMYAAYKKRKFHDFCKQNYDRYNLKQVTERLKVIRRKVNPETLKAELLASSV